MVVLLSEDRGSRRWVVRLATGEPREVAAARLEVVSAAQKEPELSTFGCEVLGGIRGAHTLEYHLWPLVQSGIIRIRVPDELQVRLNAQFDDLLEHDRAPSHALFLQGEIKGGRQLTVRRPDEECDVGGLVKAGSGRDRERLPESCRTVPRHCVPKGCPKGAEARPNSENAGQCGPSLANLFPNSTQVDESGSMFGQSWLRSANILPKSANLDQTWSVLAN